MTRNGKIAGIFRRSGRITAPVLLFVGTPTYKVRFPYYTVARRVLPEAFARQMHKASVQDVVPEMRNAA